MFLVNQWIEKDIRKKLRGQVRTMTMMIMLCISYTQSLHLNHISCLLLMVIIYDKSCVYGPTYVHLD